MIVRNEEAVLGRCLDSVADLVDEIILVDTGSTDNTKAVAAEYAAKIYDFPWCDDFSAARNYAISQAVGDYWLWLDADDVIEGENHEKLRKILEAPEADMVFLPYWLSFDAAGTPQMISRRERIFRRSRGYRFTGAVHEAVVPSGSIRYGDAAVSHRKPHAGDPDRNLHIYQKLLLSGKRFSPREQYYYARELCDHGAYRAALPVLEQFLQEGRGWTPDNIGACLLAGRCYARLEQPDEAMQSLFRSFCYGIPQPEICCEIGGLFLERQQYPQAAFWYHLAIETGHQPHVSNSENAVFIRFKNDLLFDPDSASLRADSKSMLDAVGIMLKEKQDNILAVYINGHTAQAANSLINDRLLSSERADNVAIYLEDQVGFDPKKLICRGYGKYYPIADNATREGREQNRRVDMIILGNGYRPPDTIDAMETMDPLFPVTMPGDKAMIQEGTGSD